MKQETISNIHSKEFRSLMHLKKTPNLGDSSIKKLIATLGSATAVIEASSNELMKVDKIGPVKIKGISNPEIPKLIDKEIAFIEKHQIQVQTYTNHHYPYLLKQCIDAPVILFSRGNVSLDTAHLISIVGTRNITTQGIEMCKQMIKDLAVYQPVVVSGFAYGVDITAQLSACEHNLRTISCLAHGMNQIYPKAHQKYISEILDKQGGFFTEYWSGDKFSRKNFLGRNRIIAGLTKATVVVESASKGGALVTAGIANSYNREVFSFPGRVNDPYSQGCNALIRDQKAQLVTCGSEIAEYLGWELPKTQQTTRQKPQVLINPETLSISERKIYKLLLEKGKTQLDDMVRLLETPSHKIMVDLFNLELQNIVRPIPGALYELI